MIAVLSDLTTKMRSQTALLLFLAVAMAAMVSSSSAADPKQKLQIGIKKRVAAEDCPIKSRKGDRLQMHYTVRLSLYDLTIKCCRQIWFKRQEKYV